MRPSPVAVDEPTPTRSSQKPSAAAVHRGLAIVNPQRAASALRTIRTSASFIARLYTITSAMSAAAELLTPIMRPRTNGPAAERADDDCAMLTTSLPFSPLVMRLPVPRLSIRFAAPTTGWMFELLPGFALLWSRSWLSDPMKKAPKRGSPSKPKSPFWLLTIKLFITRNHVDAAPRFSVVLVDARYI